MNRKQVILTVSLLFALVLILAACNAGSGDKVERFAEADPGSGENIAVPGYETLSFASGKAAQSVNLINPAENNCTFVLSLVLEDGETLWTGEAISPGEKFTEITLSRPLDTGSYAATLHYDCYTIENNEPLNGADIQLTLEVK